MHTRKSCLDSSVSLVVVCVCGFRAVLVRTALAFLCAGSLECPTAVLGAPVFLKCNFMLVFAGGHDSVVLDTPTPRMPLSANDAFTPALEATPEALVSELVFLVLPVDGSHAILCTHVRTRVLGDASESAQA